MASRTEQDMVRRALSIIGVVNVGADIAAEDYEVARQSFETLCAELEARKVLYVPDRNAIELRYFEPLAQILAQRLAPDYGAEQAVEKIALYEGVILQMAPVLRLPETGSVNFY